MLYACIVFAQRLLDRVNTLLWIQQTATVAAYFGPVMEIAGPAGCLFKLQALLIP